MNSLVVLFVFAALVKANEGSWTSHLDSSDWETELYRRSLKDLFKNTFPGKKDDEDKTDQNNSIDKPGPKNNTGNNEPCNGSPLNNIPGGMDLGGLLEKVKTMLGSVGDLPEFPKPDSDIPDIPELSDLHDIEDLDMAPIPRFEIPDFYYAVRIPEEIYDEINFKAVREQIREMINQSMAEGLPPPRITNRIIPVLYGLKSGCTVNALQRLISDGLMVWANDGIEEIKGHAEELYPEPIHGLPELLEAVKTQVMSEVNRTIFGHDFDDFRSVTRFIQRAVSIHVTELNDPTVHPADLAFHLSQYLLQCTPTATFLEGFLSRLAHLRRRIVRADPLTFTVRVLKATRNPCDLDKLSPRKFQETYAIVSQILKPIQGSLNEMVFFVETALLFGNDKPIVDIFPELLGGDQARFLSQVLNRLRHPEPKHEPFPEPFDDLPEPYQNSSDLVPEPELLNDTSTADLSSSPVTPPFVMTTPEPSEPLQITPSGTSSPSRRAEEEVYKEAKLLDLLLKRLVAAKRNTPR